MIRFDVSAILSFLASSLMLGAFFFASRLSRLLDPEVKLLRMPSEVLDEVKPNEGRVRLAVLADLVDKSKLFEEDRREELVGMLDFKSLFSMVGFASKLDFNRESVMIQKLCLIDRRNEMISKEIGFQEKKKRKIYFSRLMKDSLVYK